MEKEQIKKVFTECNLPVRFFDTNPEARWINSRINPENGFYVEVEKNEKGEEKFAMFIGKDTDVTILDKEERSQHIVLLVKTERNKQRFLMGHDERQLFISPLEGNISTLTQAFKDLKSQRVIDAEQKGLKVIRQGEWFFVPEPDFQPPANIFIIRKREISLEPIQQNRIGRRGNPHIADEQVAIYEEKYQVIKGRKKMVSGERAIYVRGKVRHREHSVIELKVWHRVYRNMEIRNVFSVGYVD